MIKEQLKLKNKGFTLAEVMIAIVLIGAMATFAIPQVQMSIEKIKTGEGEQLLIELMKAQGNYKIDNGSYTTTLANLNIVIPTSKNFKTSTLSNAATLTDTVASIENIDDDYELHITPSGVISCDNGDVAGICAKLGY